MEGFQTLAECHDRAFNTLLEQFCGLSVRQPTPVSCEPHLPLQDHYAGDSRTCQALLSQCSLIFELQPSLFTLDRTRIAYIITLMSGRARAWATAVWKQQSALCLSLEEFMEEVRKVLDSLLSRREAARRLLQLRHYSRSVADYAVYFHILSAESAWNPEALFNMFLH